MPNAANVVGLAPLYDLRIVRKSIDSLGGADPEHFTGIMTAEKTPVPVYELSVAGQ